MPTMPKDHIGLPPRPEPARPAEHPFVVPDFSPSIDPAVFSNPENDQSLADIKTAIGALRQAAEAVRRGARALHEDEMRTVPARHKEALDYAYKVVRPSLMASDAATARLNAEIAGLKTKVSQPPPIDRGLAAEIRAAIARMPRDERTKAVLASMKSGDDSIASACLGGPPLLSGMSDTAHAHVRNSYATLRHPDTVKRIAALEKGMEHLERAAKLSLQYSLEVADRGIVDRATASAKRAQEAIAEANRPLLN